MWAAAANNAAAVRGAVDAGADVQARTKFKPMPLLATGGFGRRAERNSDATKQAGFTALHFAVRAGATDAVKVLLKAGATVRDTTSDGTGVLVMAIASTHYELADWLLEQGADPERRGAGLDAAAPDCLHPAAEHRRQQSRPRAAEDKLDSLTLAKKLLARGANPNQHGHEKPRRHQRRPQAPDRSRARRRSGSPRRRSTCRTCGCSSSTAPIRSCPNSTGDTPLLAASGLVIEKPGESPGTPRGSAPRR